jgi:hypothetical protein
VPTSVGKQLTQINDFVGSFLVTIGQMDCINQMITLALITLGGYSSTYKHLYFIKINLGLYEFDHINQVITLSVIALSGLH